MRRMLAGLLALSLVVMVLAAPTPALAGGRFWTGLAVGGVTGLVLGSALATPVYAAPPAAVYGPGPVYVVPHQVYVYPPPTYAPPAVYTQPQWVWNGYGWVLQPGYWR